jgi:hypothetical protein
MSKRKARGGMSFGGAMFLLLMGGVAWMTIERALADQFPAKLATHESGIHASDDCYEQESGGVGIAGIFSLDKDAIRDSDCERREAARMAQEAGLDQHAKALICSLAGSVATFGSEQACMQYDGSAPEVIVDSSQRQAYCETRRKKWYRRAQFWNNKHFYRKCVRDE